MSGINREEASMRASEADLISRSSDLAITESEVIAIIDRMIAELDEGEPDPLKSRSNRLPEVGAVDHAIKRGDLAHRLVTRDALRRDLIAMRDRAKESIKVWEQLGLIAGEEE